MRRRLFNFAAAAKGGRWTIDGCKVFCPNGKTKRFPLKVVDSAEVDAVMVVVLQPDPGERTHRNVYGVSRTGRVWRIQSSDAHSYNENNPYVRIRRVPLDSLVQVVDSADTAVTLVARTGKVIGWGVVDETGPNWKRTSELMEKLDVASKTRRPWWKVFR